MNVDVIRLKMDMMDPTGKMIPRGLRETFTCEIADQTAVWYFRDPRLTRKRVMDLRAAGFTNNVYMERLGKAVTEYKGKKKEEIRDEILLQIKGLTKKSRSKE